LTVSLEFAEFRGRFVDQTMGLGPGAVNRFLDSFRLGVGGFHRVREGRLTVIETGGQAELDLSATPKTPGGTGDFVDQSVFEDTHGGEFDEKRRV
jgi:hypothetical protein